MKVVVAMDSFKGSMGSMEAGFAVCKGIKKVCDAEVVVKPLADGGEGTTDALVTGLSGTYENLQVTGPFGKSVKVRYGILQDKKTAVIEMAEAAGITLVPKEQLNPWKATTYGVGEMIKHAIQKGCREFMVGIGGSATTEGGVGMLQALGFEFLDVNGVPIELGMNSLDGIHSITNKHVMRELAECHFCIACDVTNPLCGENGAVYIYGPQKGVKDEEKECLDKKMAHYAYMTKQYMGNDYSQQKGAGAAGGLGFGFLSYLPNVELKPGISMVLDALNMEDEIKDADIVVTGEGRLDSQTAMGKVPVGMAKLAKKYGAKVVAFGGSVTEGAERCNEEGIDAFFPILRGIVTLEEAMEVSVAKKNLTAMTEQVFRLIQM